MQNTFLKRNETFARAAEDKLSVQSPSKLESFSKDAEFKTRKMLPNVHRLFTFDPLKILILRIFKILKELIIVYLSIDTV